MSRRARRNSKEQAGEGGTNAPARSAGPRLGLVVMLLAGLLYEGGVQAAEEERNDRMVVRLVTDLDDGTLVSDLEELQPVVKTVFDEEGTRTITLGERATLWVRNASVDGTFTFERYHKGKYIDRSAELEIELIKLGIGEHVIIPGDHKFTLSPDWKLTSQDPEIRIDGNTVSLRMHKVEIFAADGAKTGPPEYRLVAAELGVLTPKPDVTIDPAKLPSPTQLTNMLSHSRKFYPLSLYLPSNTVGQGYVLYPSWQAFHVTPNGRIDLRGGESQRVPGIEAEELKITIPYRSFLGRLSTKVGLQAGVGNVGLERTMNFSPTLEPIKFRAGVGEPGEDFFLAVDPDFSKYPYKFFLADNTTKDPYAVRLLVIEWDRVVYEKGESVAVALRFLQTPEKQTIKDPVVRMAYSPYYPSSPDERHWQDTGQVEWKNDRLNFTVPDIDYGFYFFRVTILDSGSGDTYSPVNGEFMVCVIDKGQLGTTAFISNKGRNAFVAGEDVNLQAVLRSKERRPAGGRRIVLTHPDGTREQFAFQDDGARWHAQPFVIPGDVTRNLKPGRYELSIAGAPAGIAAVPFRFDLVSDQKISLYKVVKPSKYTRPMNNLVPSHSNPRLPAAINLDRAVDSLAELGYNRIDLMTYDTNLHVRPHTERETLAAGDDRLMPLDSVHQPTPRNQILNACVRNGIEFSDVFLSYNDFHLPRYIEGYIRASERWIMREMFSMRHSPALAGMMLYDEMYDMGVTGLDKKHGKLLPAIRNRLAAEALGKPVPRIKSNVSRYVSRPGKQRDPKALEEFLAYGKWERHGWGDYNSRAAKAARTVVPDAKIGTYHRTWMGVGGTLGTMNGWPPDVFENLDICSHVHYADNSTGWPHSSIMVPAFRFGRKRPVFINIPLTHEVRSQCNGEYQRQMAFAMLAQGADGVSQWGLPHTFDNDQNPGMVYGKGTTRHLNREILVPFGELVSRTEPGYQNVAIVDTLNQHLLSEYKRIAVSNQVEVLWIACWRLGYPAVFLHEDAFEESVSRFQVIFVPGIRFDGELSPRIMERLAAAIRAGTKVVVENGSELALPGVIELDNPLLDYFVRVYFPTWLDDELNKIFGESQPATDYFAKKLPELGIEPAARGPFKVGPNWRKGGQIDYLVMANFDDPDYGHTVKQIMAKPVRMPLTVPAHRGKVAYDLLAQKPIPLTPKGKEIAFELDMTRCQGGLAAFLPEDVAGLRITAETTEDNRRLRLGGDLVGRSGEIIDGIFPARIRLVDDKGEAEQEYFRVIGRDLRFEMNLPAARAPRRLTAEVRENISGQTARIGVDAPVHAQASVRLVDVNEPLVPCPREVAKFMTETRKATLVFSRRIPELEKLAGQFADALKGRGMDVTIKEEMSAFRYPAGDQELADPMNDGFHSWRSSHEVIQPATVVDEPVIIMGCKSGSYLLEGLATNGFITEMPAGGPGPPLRPSIQVAMRGLHWKYDTLCVIANDLPGMRGAVKVLLSDMPEVIKDAALAYAGRKQAQSEGTTRIEPAMSFMGNNELIMDMKFDGAGNIYVITWGHGNNLYSLGPDGALRFTRHLPEAGAWRLDVHDDRVLVCTAAGSRLYQVTLDGKPISQIRLTMDPGPVGDEEYALSYPVYEYLADTRQILQNIGRMRLLDEDGNVLLGWGGEQYRDRDVADRVLHREPRGFTFSPDRTRIAQLETTTYFTRVDYEDINVYDSHLVIRDFEGRLLHEYKDVANEREKPTATVRWTPDAPGPAVIVKGEKWQFDEKLTLLYTTAYDPGMFQLGGNRRLVRDGNALRYLDGENPEICRMGPFAVMPTYAAISPNGKLIALLDEYGLVTIHDAQTGGRIGGFTIPQLGRVLRFSSDSSSVLIGGQRGLVMKYDLQGNVAWQTSLGPYNTALENPPLYDPSFRDLTSTLWPEQHDRPGELEEIVRMGENRLLNGACESQGGWQSEMLVYHNEGYKSAGSLKVGSATVHQDVTRYLGNHATWVLEFYYKAGPGAQSPQLLAGVLVDSKYPDSVARRVTARQDWQFARIAVKSGKQCKMLRIGFRSSGGDTLVDSATLRQIRFPSVNHLSYEPLYEIEPVILTNPLFVEDYNPVGDVQLAAFGKVMVPPYGSGGKPVVEPAFLQNGRLNDISSFWYEMPPSRVDYGFPLSMALKEPRWISHVAIYFNCYDEKNVTPHFDVYVSEAETGDDLLVASVRNNRQLFKLVRFPPVKAHAVQLKLVNSIRRLRTITEVELYGPLSGKEGQAGLADPEGQNTYMGDFTRVDKRTKTLAPTYGAPTVTRMGYEGDMLWAVPISQIVVSDGKFYVSRTLGYSEMYKLAEPAKALSCGRSKLMSFSPYVTLYGGLILKCGSDGKLYCIEADTSQEIWSVQIGERPYGAPVALAEDIFIASDLGKLYKLDLANGSVMMDVELSGGVFGNIATDGTRLFMITDDGFVQCFDVRTFDKLWEVKVAEYSDSTPAVDGGVVYAADQGGIARAIDAATGAVRWSTDLGQEFCRCPVVTPTHVIFGCRGGELSVLNRADGKEIWSRQVGSRFHYEPVVLGDAVLFFEGSTAMLASLADGTATELRVPNPRSREKELIPATILGDPLASISFYKGKLFFVARCDHPDLTYNHPWHVQGGAFHVMSARAEPAEQEKGR